jgi:transcriptional regulator GlxA family with amidase domain
LVNSSTRSDHRPLRKNEPFVHAELRSEARIVVGSTIARGACAQPHDVEALARGAHMSAGHHSRKFRLAYGESPYSYLMTRRIERATALLRRGDLSVTEVCFAVGCSCSRWPPTPWGADLWCLLSISRLAVRLDSTVHTGSM